MQQYLQEMRRVIRNISSFDVTIFPLMFYLTSTSKETSQCLLSGVTPKAVSTLGWEVCYSNMFLHIMHFFLKKSDLVPNLNGIGIVNTYAW